MAQNITLMGASYSDVPAVQLPKTGGGTALFSDPSITTAIASDVASGKTFLLADGSIGTGTASGGGGASNVVTGTFKGTTSGQALNVSVDYQGTGYPIAVIVYPKEGPYNSQKGTFYDLVSRYSMQSVLYVKAEMDTQPTYDGQGSNNHVVYLRKYKSSTSSATTYSQTGGNTGAYFNNVNASSGGTNGSNSLQIKSAKTLSFYITSSGFGFATNIEYTYHVIYSS